jgi:hypothetical protein
MTGNWAAGSGWEEADEQGRLQGLRAVTSGRVQAEVVWTGHQ